ncbi:multiple C2 and transmembrane domain-containing protein [Culicoides brevitarsis]|uniref:multiple C2 and transmembrane domain-containing protein n=1 Tax=Culicoides brevitarsis TaxID=469753 RepID=UPI00307CB3FD
MADSPSTKRSKLGLDSNCIKLRKNISKSTSELSYHESCRELTEEPKSPKRVKSAGTAAGVTGVLQKTHGFFNNLRNRLSRGRSKERVGRKSPIDHDEHNKSSQSDGMADSSDYSNSNTPLTQSPRHRATTADSPLARTSANSGGFGSRQASKTDSFKIFTTATASSTGAKLERQQSHEKQKKRENELRKHSFFQLRVTLKEGRGLVAMDKSGTSDPYVKFKVGGRMLYKSKTVHKDLNPKWDETFIVPVEDPFLPINIKVFDYDWGLQDDFMGASKLSLLSIDLNQQTDVTLRLEDPSRPEKDLGELLLSVILWPKTQEDKEQYFQRNPKLADASRRLKSQIWSSVVTTVLVEAKGLPPDLDGGIDEPFVKFRLGNEKFKSKVSYRAKWLEQFDLHLFDDDQILEVVVCGKYNNYGRCTIDLSNLQREQTHTIWQPLEDCSAEVLLMLTISGTTASETISDLTTYKEDPKERAIIESRYGWRRTFENMRDIGHLTVKVYSATGLAAADLGGKSDPFCVLELGNARLQTQTEYKTLTPNWNKIFTFNVKDITSVLEITVFDEDRDHKVEFLGRVAIPLLRIRNGEKRWYALKDKKLCGRAKGNCPQILLELSVLYSPIRAGLRVLEPKEEKLIQQEVKFKRQLFMRNVARLKAIIMFFIEVGQFIQSCLEWESPIRSMTALIFWICGCIWFDISTVPAVLLLYLLKNWIVAWLTGTSSTLSIDDGDLGSDDEDDDDKDKEEKKTIKERLQAIQEASQTVQNTIGYLASLGESVKNTFNFAVPELSWLTAFVLFMACLILHYIPMRVILLAWGLIKFSKRLIRPHVVPNNEVLDLLSRVPDDDEMIMYRELTLHTAAEPGPSGLRGRDQRKNKKLN